MSEYIGLCNWSKTGWALWKNAGCTCREVPKPKDEKKATEKFRERLVKEREIFSNRKRETPIERVIG